MSNRSNINLVQLRSMQQVVKDGLSLTRAAQSLHASQPGVTRHIQQLENELGMPLLVRENKRAIGLTSAGTAVLPVIHRALSAIEDLHRISAEFRDGTAGEFTIATVHAYARYVLPPAISQFVTRFPKVRLRIRNGHRTQVVEWLAAGEADFSIGTLPEKLFPELVFFPYYEAHLAIFTPVGHPLLRKKRVTLEDVVSYPIITYDRDFGSREDIDRVFGEKQLPLNIVLGAADAEIMKTYVLAGLGIGIFTLSAYDKKADPGLRMISAAHLLRPRKVHIGLRREAHLNQHALRLIEIVAPHVYSKIIS